MYNSPIKLFTDEITRDIAKKQDALVFNAVARVGVTVDRDELLRALRYDRGQYDAGFTDGRRAATPKWIPVTERLPCKEEYTAMAEDGTEYYARLLIAYKTDVVEYEIGYYDGCKWMTEMPIRFLIKDVVAWMPFPEMPEPPKEVE